MNAVQQFLTLKWVAGEDGPNSHPVLKCTTQDNNNNKSLSGKQQQWRTESNNRERLSEH